MGSNKVLRTWFDILSKFTLTLAVIIAVSVLFLPSLGTVVPSLGGPPESPIHGGGPTPIFNDSARVSIDANALDRHVGPGEQGTVTIRVSNLETHNNTLDIQFVIEGKPGVTLVESSNNSVTLSSGETKTWTVPVELTSGIHSLTVDFYYTFSDLDFDIHHDEEVVFSRDDGTPTPIQRGFSFILVTVFTSVCICLIDNNFVSDDDASIYSIGSFGIALGSFTATTGLAEFVLETAIGTGLTIVAVFSIAFLLWGERIEQGWSAFKSLLKEL